MIRYVSRSRDTALLSKVRAGAERMQALHPAPGDVTIRCVEKHLPSGDPSIAGTLPATGDIEVNLPALRKAMEEKTDGFWMPEAAKVELPLYVMAHEWGHLFLATGWGTVMRMVLIGEITDNDRQARTLFRAMSEYAKSSPEEALAEAHAEFYLSLGKTKNRLALTVASENGWTIPANV